MPLVRTCLLALLLAAVGACAGGDEAAPRAERPLVVVTTSILGDVVERTVGDVADVEVLIPDGAEIHDAQPSARQRARIAEADLLVAVGLGLETGYLPVLRDAAAEGTPLLEIAPRLDPLGADPHVWTDPARLAAVPDQVVDALLAADATIDAPALRAGAGAAAEALRRLDDDIEALVAEVPVERRLLVTDHEVLAYFADRYGFTVVGALVPAQTTGAEASAGDLAALAAAARAAGVPAVFTEAAGSDDLARSLAEEIGDDVAVVALRLESIGDADGWAAVLLDDARAIARALAP